MLCMRPEEGGIDQMEGVLHSFNKQWKIYYVVSAGNSEINRTQPSGEIGIESVTSTCSDRDRHRVMDSFSREALVWARSHRSSQRASTKPQRQEAIWQGVLKDQDAAEVLGLRTFMQARTLATQALVLRGFTVLVS